MRLLPIRGLAIRTLAIRIMALTVMLLAAWPAAAQLTREELALRNQIYELQQQVQTLQQQAANQGGGGSYLGRPGYPPPPTGSSSDIVAHCWPGCRRWKKRCARCAGAWTRCRTSFSSRAPISPSASTT